MQTPCKKWNVHDVVNHIVGGGLMISSALTQDLSAAPDMGSDLLTEGPAIGWAGAVAGWWPSALFVVLP